MRIPAFKGTQSRVLGHGAIYIVGTVLQRGLSLLLLPFVTRILDVEEYGLVGTAVALAALLAIIYSLGLNFSIVRSYYDDSPENPTTGWSALLRAQVLVAAAMAGITYLTGPYWSQLFHDFQWVPAIQVAVLYAYVTALQGTAQGVLRAARRPVAFVVTSVIQLVVGSGLGIWLAISLGAEGYLLGLTVGSVLATLVAVGVTYRRPRWSAKIIRAGFALGLPFMVHNLSSWGLNLADRLLVAVYLGLSDVGRYQVAYILASAMILLLTSVQQAWAPHFIGEMSEQGRRRAPPLMIVPVTVLAGVATGLLVLAAPLLLDVLAPSEFGGTELVIALVASATLSRAAYFVAVVVLLDAKNTGPLARSSLSAGVLNIGLNVAFLPTYGLNAAAAATTAAVAVQSLMVIRASQAHVDGSMRIGALCLVWAAGTAVLIGFAELPQTGAGFVARLALALVMFVVGYVAVVRLRRVLQIADPPAPAPSEALVPA